MATAVNKSAEMTSAPNPQQRLLVSSAVGAVYVAGGIAVLAFGLPHLWQLLAGRLLTNQLNLVYYAGLVALILAGVVALVYLGVRFAGNSLPEGTRAGVFTLLAGGLGIFLATMYAGQLIERYLLKTPDQRMLGLGATAVIGALLVFAAVRYVLKPQFAEFLLRFEGHGWFRARFYKANQGQLVRRLTILGMLFVLGTGIWSLDQHNSLGSNAADAWKIRLPFAYAQVPLYSAAGELLQTVNVPRYVRLLPHLSVIGPVLLAAAGLWLTWRAVNYPMFADFLIATEAEMNKVSWASRRKLVQDTIVVLITVFLFTIFLLAIDQTWGWVLSRDMIRIVPKAKVSEKQQTDAGQQDW